MSIHDTFTLYNEHREPLGTIKMSNVKNLIYHNMSGPELSYVSLVSINNDQISGYIKKCCYEAIIKHVFLLEQKGEIEC